MKSTRLLTTCFFIFCSLIMADDSPKFRSDEYLAASIWTDHTRHFAKLLELTPVDSFLEFGVGEGTKYYLDHCGHVTSIELLDKNKMGNEPYYKMCLELYKSYSNWTPILHICGKAVDMAVDVAENQRINPVTVSSSYMKELNQICDQLFKNRKYDVAFVDSAVIVRGSIVNALFNRVDIIIAHDFNMHPTIYGWDWIEVPSNYEQIYFREGSGTVFWINKTRQDLIDGLKQYL